MISGGELLLDDDLAFLERKGWTCSISRQPDGTDVIVHDYPLPDRYTPEKTDLMIKVLPGYPNVGLDMFWTYPHVRERTTGSYPNACDQFQDFQGRSWQRWSRHSPWRAGIDNFETYFAAIGTELRK